ncbi:flavin monoamine oxidase family protein [Nonomuraea jiangxiensis]|uniref:Monoamine oxidase n=1 Tax=Nonomuraea jiangxiensis TaxID=633440 RepID=A0A1G8S089_9ACTN|nr:NAD(P)/FAD-dependent oxidoreductase [Nonomuraea jiangxiensis]SDJ22070.1 monoamine oxidase [Nonomuraea jiangxiensis]
MPNRITVLGAGIAGLVAAWELEQLGYSVEVLEGSSRCGGRIYTHRFADAQPAPLVELGAMRIPTNHLHTRAYIDKLGLNDRVRDFRTLFSEDGAYHTTSAGFVRVGEAAEVLVEEFRTGMVAERYGEPTILFGAWLMAMADAIAPPDFRITLQKELGRGLLDELEGLDLAPFRYGRGRDRIDLHAFFAAHPQVRTAWNGRLNHFIDDVLNETSPELIRLEGGMDQLITGLVERIRGPITYGQEVVGIHVRDNDVLLEIRDGAGVTVRRCDQVLCTVPFSMVRRMSLSGFDGDKLDVIHAVKYWSATKVAFHCREAFWEHAGISGGASYSGGRIRQTYYPAAEGVPGGGAVLLASYTMGDDADRLGRMPPAACRSVVLDELSKMHPELRRPGMVLDSASLAWGQHRWSEGAGVTRWGMSVAASEEQRSRAARPQGRLFFAGEHCSSTPAWIDGAIESALEAVGQIRLGTREDAVAVGSH